MKYQLNIQSDLKINNQRNIIKMLIEYGQMSRANLAKKMKATRPTISNNVNDLIDKGLVIEVGKADNSMGKKGTLLDFHKSYGFVLVIELLLNTNAIVFVLSNLKNEIISSKEYAIGDREATALLTEFINDNELKKKNILEVVISTPGVVGADNSTHLYYDKINEITITKLKQSILEVFNKKVSVMNDVNLAIIAEKKLGEFKARENLYYVYCDIGIGAAIIVNDVLFLGDRNAAGEFAYNRSYNKSNNSTETLENRISLLQLLRNYKQATNETIELEEYIRRLNMGDEKAKEIYEDMRIDLAYAIVNAITILDIECVVVSGRFFQLRDDTVEELNKIVSSLIPFTVILKYSSIDNSSIKGAIDVGINNFMEYVV